MRRLDKKSNSICQMYTIKRDELTQFLLAKGHVESSFRGTKVEIRSAIPSEHPFNREKMPMSCDWLLCCLYPMDCGRYRLTIYLLPLELSQKLEKMEPLSLKEQVRTLALCSQQMPYATSFLLSEWEGLNKAILQSRYRDEQMPTRLNNPKYHARLGHGATL
jgi:hypothetical protein